MSDVVTRSSSSNVGLYQRELLRAMLIKGHCIRLKGREAHLQKVITVPKGIEYAEKNVI